MTFEGSPRAELARGAIAMLLVGFAIYGLRQIHPEPVAAREGTAVVHPWAKGGVQAGGQLPMYVVLANTGATTERLLFVTSPLAERVVIKQLVREQGLIRPNELEDLPLAPGSRLAFRPGERQITLIGARERIEPGDRIPLTFVFERGGAMNVSLHVENLGQPEHDDHF